MILVLGGTADTHEYLCGLSGGYIISVATEYGYKHFRDLYGEKLILTRFSRETLELFIKDNDITAVADTTHTFATEISNIAMEVCERLNVPYINAKRPLRLPEINYSGLIYVSCWAEAVSVLKERRFSPLFLTIGSKNLTIFKELLDGAVVRVLDDCSSVGICRGLGVTDNRIIAARGPFTLEDNLKVINKFNIKCLVTKESGVKGGLPEKAEAAERTGINIIVVGAPSSSYKSIL
ncbi:MAG: precorrin-6A reductase [Deferribacteraceae bacterium]|jgi:precorrin-6A/cobalt-precorrin-6A reductase|nr:precorrin-6A reductase [Deferribacteraceae bacterium]